MVFTNDVRGNDERPLRMLAEITQEDFFVRRPRGTCNENMRIPCALYKLLHQWQLLRLFLNLQHSVEAGVANDFHFGDAKCLQQFATLFVLYKEVGETLQYAPILPSIPAEEHLLRTEDAADTIHWHLTMLQDVQVVEPELILDEESHAGTHRTQETTGVADGVEGQIADNVGTFVVLPDLIARRREEREQDFILRMLAAQTLHEWTALFELSERGSMEPHILCLRVYFLLEHTNGLALATPHLAHLLAEKARYGNAAEVKIDYDLIHQRFCNSGSLFRYFVITNHA